MSNSVNNSVRLLVAEDNDFDFTALLENLRAVGIDGEIVWCFDGVELMEYIECRGRYENRPEDNKINLIILDLNMPRIDGINFLQQLRAHEDPDIRDTYVIVVTTSTLQADLEAATKMGILDFIIKPDTLNDTRIMCQDIGKHMVNICENRSA
ncbi:MAG: response regulator [Alphaproteobacteria bacterium]